MRIALAPLTGPLNDDLEVLGRIAKSERLW